MTPAEVLRAARERISTPERWTRDAFARDPEGWAIDPKHERACAWCTLGAICSVLPGTDPDPGDGRGPLFDAARALLARAIGRELVAWWNDNPVRTHAEVLAAFDRAIELDEAEAQVAAWVAR